MAVPPKAGKFIYHLTALDNLRDILAQGLQARNQLQDFCDVADEEIIIHRRKHDLNGYVPFHFFAPSPFAGAVQQKHTDKEFIYIALHRDLARTQNFKILLRHPLSMDSCIPLDYEDGFNRIEWEEMEKRDFTNHDNKMICMAECLSPETVKPEDFHALYSRTKDVQKNVLEIVRETYKREKLPFFVNEQTSFFKKR